MRQVEHHNRFPPKAAPLFERHRYKVLHGGRGSAKSWSIARALITIAMQRQLRVLCTREYQNSIRESVHTLLKSQIKAMGVADAWDVQRSAIYGPHGSEFVFAGLHTNIEGIQSYEGIDVCWIEEANTVSEDSLQRLLPTIRKPGSEIWISFNPEFEDDPIYKRFVTNTRTGAAVVEMNWRDNDWFPAELDIERQDDQRLDPDNYDWIWEGKTRNWMTGAIYARELREAYDQGRVRSVPFDPNIEVHTAWDIGRTDDTAIWWYQQVGDEIHILESEADAGGDAGYWASRILGVQTTVDIVGGRIQVELGDPIKGLEHRAQYTYGTHWLPHDARAKTFAAMGKSVQEQLETALGHRIRIVPGLSREDGIKAVRMAFRRFWLDEERCASGLKAARRYQREVKADGVSRAKAPKHDWTSHLMDALRMLAVAFESKPERKPEPAPRRDAYDWEGDDDVDWKAA